MKNTTFYLILAAVVIFILYRMNKKKQETAATSAPGNITPDTAPDDQETDDQETDDIIIQPVPVIKTETIRECPYCGTKNAIVTTWTRGGKTIRRTVACPNKSCPGSPTVVKAAKAEILQSDR